MDRYRIRTSATDSVKGLAKRQNINVSLRQTTKTLPFPNVSATLSQRSVYEEERQAGNKFRLILTVVPYCTNVLFNPLTEIIKDEGSDKPVVITDTTNVEVEKKENVLEIKNAIGKSHPRRVDMISNTEYSSELHGGYEYHPGYDFFDNHILRNKSFKLINPLSLKTSTEMTNVFNTLEDYTRDRNGDVQYFSKRVLSGIEGRESSSSNEEPKHLYIREDILSVEESINQNLYEENGWWGFINPTTVDTKKLSNRKWESMDISHALNNHKSCEFIDMYPDRSLFSFTPKYNKYTRENEKNWNIVLTYPYKNIYSHPLCFGGSSYITRSIDSDGDFVEDTVSFGGRWTGIKVVYAYVGDGKIGSNNLVFRTYTKHGLSQGDMFYLYYTNPYCDQEIVENVVQSIKFVDCEKFGEESLDGREVYYESESYHKVTNTGNTDKEYNDYYFYTSDMSLLKEIYKSYLQYVERLFQANPNATTEELKVIIPFYELYLSDDQQGIYDEDNELKTELLNNILKYSNFRIRRYVNGVKSLYYIRQFRQIPNLRAAQRGMTEEESKHKSKFNGVFDAYVSENAYDPNFPQYQRSFNNETYQLGFSSNIYNDNVTQITFTDGIDVTGLTDNLGRPLSEIYYTIVKNNAGNEVWYDNKNPIYSNAVLSNLTEDDRNTFKSDYGVDYDGYKIEFSHCFGRVTSGFETHVETTDTEYTVGPRDYWKKLSSVYHISNVTNKNKEVHEDEVSNPLETNIKYYNKFFYGDLVEYNAAECQEHVLSNVLHRFNTAQRETIKNKYYSQYQYHEIMQDDYDPQDFEVVEFSAVSGMKDEDWSPDYETIARPEGYCYRAHYPIYIREYTDIQQGSHYTLRIRAAKPVQRGQILIQVTTYTNHGLSENDIIYICDDESDIRYITRCVGVIDKVTFLMSPQYDEYIENASYFDDIETTNNIKQMTTSDASKNVNRYKKRFSWLQLCQILNGEYADDDSYPSLILRRKNTDLPDYAFYIGNNQYLWRNTINIGDATSKELKDYVFANGYFYVTQQVNFYLKRQDPFNTNGLYFDGDDGGYPYFPNDPSGDKQEENNYITKDTESSCLTFE